MGRKAAFGVTFVVAAAMRLWGVTGLLPYVHHPDEITNEQVAVKVAHAPLESPRFFRYPSLMFYLQATVIAADEARTSVRVLPIELVSLGNARARESTHIALGRGLTALVSATTAVVTLAFVLEAGAPLAVGCAAGIAVAMSPTLVEHGRYITPDAYAAFFTMLTLFLACRVARGATPATYALAGASIGLSAGCKYNLAVVALAVVVAHCFREGLRRVLDVRLAVAALCSIVAFVVSTPFAIFDHSSFVEGLTFEANHYSKGHAGSEGGSFAFYLLTLWHACGPWALLSVASLWDRRRETALVTLSFSVVYLLFLSSFTVHFDRNAVPLAAPLIGLGALGAWGLFRRLAERAHRPNAERKAVLAVVALAGVVAAVSFPSIVRQVRDLRTNHRASAERWIAAHVPEGSSIIVEGYGPWIDPERYRIRGITNFAAPSMRQIESNRFAVLAEAMYGRFLEEPEHYKKEAQRYTKLMQRYCTAATFSESKGEAIRILDLKCTP